ncbi:hypothetical protein ACFL27_21265, partial [candidate division CSSED10-310 bacterium]
TKTYPVGDLIFRGSSTDPPTVPASILIESMAQVSAAVSHSSGAGSSPTQNRAPQPGYLVAINHFEYLKPVLADSNDTEPTIFAEITHSFGLMLKSQCSISVQNEVVAKAELSFRLIENHSPAL